jgi:hypothetical protein
MLCPIIGGALKRTDTEQWCHVACAKWTPELSLDPTQEVAICNAAKVGAAKLGPRKN